MQNTTIEDMDERVIFGKGDFSPERLRRVENSALYGDM